MPRLLLSTLILSAAALVYGAIAPDHEQLNPVALAAALDSIAEAEAEAEPDPSPEPVPSPAPVAPSMWRDYASAYAEIQSTGSPLVVLFGMDGCAPCAEVKAEIEADKQDGVVYCYIDVVQEPEVAKNFGYVTPGFSVPQTYVYHSVDGEWKVAHFSGRPVRGAIVGAIRRAKSGVKRVAQVAKTVVQKPVEFLQTKQPVRRVLRRLCPSCR